jgi:peptide/nickel transport system substrate-binding protein
MDWQTLVARRAKKDPLAQGGWSAFFTSWGSPDVMNPVAAAFINASCDKATFGWPCDEALEKAARRLCQGDRPGQAEGASPSRSSLRLSEAYPTFAPLGQFTQPTAAQDQSHGLLQTPSLALVELEKK